MMKHPRTLVPNYESANYDHLSMVSTDYQLLIFASHPYSSQSVKLAQYARDIGLPVVAITDSDQSPLIPLASNNIVADQIPMTYLPSRVPFFAVIEYLTEIGCSKQDRRTRKNPRLFRRSVEKRSGYWVPNFDSFSTISSRESS